MIRNYMLAEAFLTVWYVYEIMFLEKVSLYRLILIGLVYLSIKVGVYIVRLYKEKHDWTLWLVLIYLLVIGYSFPPILLFFGLTVMQTNSHKVYVRALLSLAILSFFMMMIGFDSIIMSINAAISLGFVLVEGYDHQLRDYKLRLKATDQKLKEAKLSALLTERFEDEISTISKLEERNYIVQQLHDKLGHVMSGNIIQLEAVSLLFDKKPEEAKEKLNVVRENLSNGMDDVRSILKDMKPESVVVNIEKVKSLISETKRQSGIDIQLIYDECISLIDYPTWKVLTVNIQETMTNMMKYSDASSCKVKFSRLNKMIKVTIEDNGVGCRNIKKVWV